MPQRPDSEAKIRKSHQAPVWQSAVSSQSNVQPLGNYRLDISCAGKTANLELATTQSTNVLFHKDIINNYSSAAVTPDTLLPLISTALTFNTVRLVIPPAT